jgi:hypothetical protein
MRPGKNGILVFVVILLIAVGAFALFIRESILHSRTPATPRDLWLEVTPEKETYIVGEPVVLNLTIYNDADKEVEILTYNPLEQYVSFTLGHDDKDAFEYLGPVTWPPNYSSTIPSVHRCKIAPRGSVVLRVLFCQSYQLDKSGEFRGTLTLDTRPPVYEVEDEDIVTYSKPDGSDEPSLSHDWPKYTDVVLKADFKIQVVTGASLREVTRSLYHSWYASDNYEDREISRKALTYVHSDAAIPYLTEMVLAYNDTDACDGLARIKSVASVTELVTLAENNALPQFVADHCIALIVDIYKNTKNEEIKKIAKEIAEKYPDGPPERPSEFPPQSPSE